MQMGTHPRLKQTVTDKPISFIQNYNIANCKQAYSPVRVAAKQLCLQLAARVFRGRRRLKIDGPVCGRLTPGRASEALKMARGHQEKGDAVR